MGSRLSCSTCSHPQIKEIDRLIATGTDCEVIAERFGLVSRSVRRHAANHLKPELRAQAERAGAAPILLAELETLKRKALNVLEKAEMAEKTRDVCLAIKEARQTIEVIYRLIGPVQERGNTTVIVNNPTLVSFQNTVLNALAAYPDARIALANELAKQQQQPPVLDHGNG